MIDKEHLRIAKLVKKAYTKKTFSVNEIEFWVKKEAEATLILFRGTELSHLDSHTFYEKAKDHIDTLRDIRTMPWRDCKTSLWGHAGFLRGARKVVKKIEEEMPDKETPLVISGHSLGGAIACAVAVFLSRKGYNIKELVGLASPRVFLGKVKGLDFPITLYRNSGDLITMVPWGRHMAALTKIGPKHSPQLKSHPIDKYITSLCERGK